MKILSASDLRHVDQATIERQKIRSFDLMERAARGLFNQIIHDFPAEQTSVTIVCGSGNNGGDGLALARMLHEAGRLVNLFLLQAERYSADNAENQAQLQTSGLAFQFFNLDQGLPIHESPFNDADIIIDALFGVGLSRPLNLEWTKVIRSLNEAHSTILALDIPSGLLADEASDPNGLIVQAKITYTLHCPKFALLQPENAAFVGDMRIVDISLDEEAVSTIPSLFHFTTSHTMRRHHFSPNRFAHKGTFGHVLVIGGSYGKIGAAQLSAKSALRTGCGLVTIYSPSCAYPILQTNFPEAMLITDETFDHIGAFPNDISGFTALAIGMGIGQAPKTVTAFLKFLDSYAQQKSSPALVLDADAINILSSHPEMLAKIPAGSILTPHPKELQRLIGPWTDDWDKIEKSRDFAARNQIVVLIKGSYTAVILPDGNIHFNSTGNWGMATGGSGDVLSGIIASLRAQKFSSADAAIIGVYLHGLAGDLALTRTHPKSLIASDIIQSLSAAWNDVFPFR